MAETHLTTSDLARARARTKRKIAVGILSGLTLAIGAIGVAAARTAPEASSAAAPTTATDDTTAGDTGTADDASTDDSGTADDTATAEEVALGAGFAANIDGTTVTISHTCEQGQDVYTRTTFSKAPDGFEPSELVGSGSENPLKLTNDFGRIYGFTCKAEAAPISGDVSECVAFSETDGVITPTTGVCPTHFPVVETKFIDIAPGPGIRFPDRLGAKKPYEDMSVVVTNLGNKGCEFGVRMELRLDGTPLGSWPIDQGKPVTLGALSGEHRLTTTCEYKAPTGPPSDPEFPSPAQRGACVSISFKDDGSFTSKDCTGPLSERPNEFGLRSDDAKSFYESGVKTSVVGGCGGYGFETYTTTADGTITSNAASAHNANNDINKLKAPLQADPVGFFVGVCWTDMDNTVPGPLACYHVAGKADNLYLEPTDPQRGTQNCPFTTLKTVSTR